MPLAQIWGISVILPNEKAEIPKAKIIWTELVTTKSHVAVFLLPT